MNTEILDELYEATYQFQNWNARDYDSFDEAESDFFDTIDKARSKNITEINRGGERTVYSGGNLFGQDKVIKIARNGLDQNETAVQMFTEHIPEGAKDYVAKITKWSDGYEWIVQERAYGRGDTQKVGEKLAEYNLGVSDLNGQNVGKIDGRSVLIDLGLLR